MGRTNGFVTAPERERYHRSLLETTPSPVAVIMHKNANDKSGTKANAQFEEGGTTQYYISTIEIGKIKAGMRRNI